MRNAIVDQILMERMNRRGGYDGRDYARGDYGLRLRILGIVQIILSIVSG